MQHILARLLGRSAQRILVSMLGKFEKLAQDFERAAELMMAELQANDTAIEKLAARNAVLEQDHKRAETAAEKVRGLLS